MARLELTPFPRQFYIKMKKEQLELIITNLENGIRAIQEQQKHIIKLLEIISKEGEWLLKY